MSEIFLQKNCMVCIGKGSLRAPWVWSRTPGVPQSYSKFDCTVILNPLELQNLWKALISLYLIKSIQESDFGSFLGTLKVLLFHKINVNGVGILFFADFKYPYQSCSLTSVLTLFLSQTRSFTLFLWYVIHMKTPLLKRKLLQSHLCSCLAKRTDKSHMFYEHSLTLALT